MKYAIILSYDENSEADLRMLGHHLQRAGLSSGLIDTEAGPHVTLAVLGELAPDAVSKFLAHLARERAPMDVQLSSIGSFATVNGVVFLAPVVTPTLLSLHGYLHQWLEQQGIAADPHYQPGNWVPHTTVAMALEPPEVARAIMVCSTYAELYGQVRLTRIRLLAMEPVSEVISLRLAGED